MKLREDIQVIEERLRAYRAEGRRLFATSSFQSGSVVLLHLLSRFAPDTPIYFINTGYHFPETLRFRDQLAARLGLRVHELFSPVPRSGQRDSRGRLLFMSDPESCCRLNKLLPLEPVLPLYEVWINGIRADQSVHRSLLQRECDGPAGLLRYHPLLHWSHEQVRQYRQRYALPAHPLDAAGTLSIGCAPCTRLDVARDSREGRWQGQRRTECGLHTHLAEARA